jgi:hypothetical protein
MLKLISILATLLFVSFSHGFTHPSMLQAGRLINNEMNVDSAVSVLSAAKNDDNEQPQQERNGIVGGFMDFFSNLDDVADDFFYKRMGKGEIFYGKRKYKPSGDVDGEYNGFGLSDKMKIDMTREYKEAWLEEKQMRDELRAIKEEKEARDRAR